MIEHGALGRLLVVVGIVLVVIGVTLAFWPRIPWLGRLPGDFSFGGPHFRLYVPLGTSILLSILLSLLLRLFFRR
jgi:hypothetical protein